MQRKVCLNKRKGHDINILLEAGLIYEHLRIVTNELSKALHQLTFSSLITNASFATYNDLLDLRNISGKCIRK